MDVPTVVEGMHGATQSQPCNEQSRTRCGGLCRCLCRRRRARHGHSQRRSGLATARCDDAIPFHASSRRKSQEFSYGASGGEKAAFPPCDIPSVGSRSRAPGGNNGFCQFASGSRFPSDCLRRRTLEPRQRQRRRVALMQAWLWLDARLWCRDLSLALAGCPVREL
jgi:hypothetical protein